jgi:eukaryotic-like serine/threonine-protein kinase
MVEQTISHYRIREKLGAGGTGVVHKALDAKLERSVALKFLPAGFAVSEEDRRNLLREARTASAVDHSNIGVVHGLEESEDGQLFIGMQYYDGETPAKNLARSYPRARIAGPRHPDRQRPERSSRSQHRAPNRSGPR